jgi:hypothetical protein
MANTIPYGFMNLKDKYPETVANNLVAVNTAITQNLAELQSQYEDLFGLFVEPTTERAARFSIPGTVNFTGTDEYGRVLPVKRRGYYDAAWPMQKAGIATGETWEAGIEMTIAQAADMVMSIRQGFVTWHIQHMLAALYQLDGVSYSSESDPTVTYEGLANGDAITYATLKGASAPATDNHLLAQAASISDSNDPFPTMADELIEHPENGNGTPIAFIPTNLVADVRALTQFLWMPDPNVDPGAINVKLIGTPPSNTPGKVIGYHKEAGCWLVQWDRLPSSYMIATVPGAIKPIRFRQKENPALRGVVREGEINVHPFKEVQYSIFGGYASWNRVGALVYRIGNGTYAAAPTGYAVPLA